MLRDEQQVFIVELFFHQSYQKLFKESKRLLTSLVNVYSQAIIVIACKKKVIVKHCICNVLFNIIWYVKLLWVINIGAKFLNLQIFYLLILLFIEKTLPTFFEFPNITQTSYKSNHPIILTIQKKFKLTCLFWLTKLKCI